MKEELYIVLLGGRAEDDKLEAHNLFIGVGKDLPSLLPAMKKSWSAATHVDAYMILRKVDDYAISLQSKNNSTPAIDQPKLFVINIGYYKQGEFAEFHKLIPMVIKAGESTLTKLKTIDPDFIAGQTLGEAARSHIDDKHQIIDFDVDDAIEVQEHVTGHQIILTPAASQEVVNSLEIGYLKFAQLEG
jgi:hypothetical protein